MITKKNISYIKVNREAYDKFANELEEYHKGANIYDTKTDQWYNFIFSKFNNKLESKTVLEIGPGDGKLLDFFEGNNCRTIAVELSYNMSNIAKKRSPNTVIINDDILKVKFLDNQFDIIFAAAVIHNFPYKDAKKVMKRIYSWLKPGGLLCIYTTIHDSSEEGFFEKSDYNTRVIRYRKKWMDNEFREFVNSFNLNIIDEMYTDQLDKNKKWLVLLCRK